MLRSIRNVAGAVALALIVTVSGWQVVFGSQGSTCMPTTGTVSGLTLVQNMNNALAAVVSMFSGANAPVTDCSAASVKGQMWLDTNTNTVKQYDGVSWLSWGTMDVVSHVWQPVIGGGAASVPSGSTVNLGATAASLITITGTTTITSFGSSAATGSVKYLTFESALTLTASANIILPGGVNIATEAGDMAQAIYRGGGVWSLMYQRASGAAVVNPALDIGIAVNYFGGAVPGKYLLGTGAAISRASYPAYVAATTIVKSAGRTSGSPTLTVSSGDTVLMGAGMPVEGTGIQSGTTIVRVSDTSITLSKNAATTGTSNITVFITGYGTGGDSNTIGLPNCLGRVMVGVDNDGGVTSNAVQVQTTITTTNLSATATVASATNIATGQYVVSANVPPGTRVNAINGTTLTLSANATGSASGTAARFSSIADAQALMSYGGVFQRAILTPNAPSYTPAGSVTGTASVTGSGTGTATNGQATLGGTTPGVVVPTFSGGAANGSTLAVSVSVSASGNISASFNGSNNNGRSEPFETMVPSITARCMVRVLAGLIPANDDLPVGESRLAIDRRLA